MLRILIVLAFITGVYQLYTKHWLAPGTSPVSQVDSNGKPVVVLVVGPGCGDHCGSIRRLLEAGSIPFQEIDVAGPDGAPVDNQYGINTYPTTVIGKVRVQGSDLGRIKEVLAETYGGQIWSPGERMAMAGHFDQQGRPKVVMYGTPWCGYCKAQRELFAQKNIPFDDLDVEASGAAASAYNGLKGTGYPLTYVGYRRFSGYHQDDILAAIDELVAR